MLPETGDLPYGSTMLGEPIFRGTAALAPGAVRGLTTVSACAIVYSQKAGGVGMLQITGGIFLVFLCLFGWVMLREPRTLWSGVSFFC